MPAILERLRTRLGGALGAGADDRQMARVRRRRVFLTFIGRAQPILRSALLVVGFAWLLILPSRYLGRGVYIDENALQPAQVSTYWNWGDVHTADRYLAELEKLRDSNASSNERADFLKLEFEKLGMHAAKQAYRFSTPSQPIEGENAYAILSAARTTGNEAIILSAPWKSSSLPGSLNLRGVSTLLALASFLKKYSHWARDIIFVASDDDLAGMQAWLSTYHDEVQSNLETQSLDLTSGVVWNALNIDYPGHSFSHLGLFYEGLNGRLPNQDLMNSIQIIARHTGGCPVVLYDDVDEMGLPHFLDWIPTWVRDHDIVRELFKRTRSILRHMYFQGSGRGSGIHGLYHKYRIDAITLFAVPATGPHGFYTIGKTIESSLRTMNNLLERLHASFFFYIMTSAITFHKIGHYLPAVIMISMATMLGALKTWVDAGWRRESGEKSEEWVRQKRSVLEPLSAMLGTHVLGLVAFYLLSEGLVGPKMTPFELTADFMKRSIIELTTLSLACSSMAKYASARYALEDEMQSRTKVFLALVMFVTSTFVSVMSLLNFSLATLLCLSLILPLNLLTPSSVESRARRNAKRWALLLVADAVLSLATVESSFWYWTVLGVWFSPFICIIVVPLLLQMAIVCSLS